MDIKITKASGNDITLVVTPLANQKIVIDRGVQGATGATGAGVATGGTTGQVLAKLSNANYDTTWINSSSQIYPSAGIPNSTGTAWGTSYSVTGTGNVVLSTSPTLTNPTQASYESWTPITAPSYLEGRLWYDSVQHSLAYYNDAVNSLVHVGQEVQTKVINNTGSTITIGAPVYVTSTSSGQIYPNVALAQANSVSTSSVLGLATQSIANGAIGYVTSYGILQPCNTGLFNVGDVLYLSPYTAGVLMNTIPPTGNVIIVGVVAYKNSPNGSIYVKQQNSYVVSAGTLTGTVAVANGGTGLSSLTAGSITYGAGTSNYVPLAIGTTGQVLTVNSGGTAPQWSTPTAQVYPSAGIPNSTGTAWGTSYSTTGTGNVVLSDSPTFTTAITATGDLQLTGGNSATAQNIGTSQQNGALNIGGTSATGALNIGSSITTQAVNVGGTGGTVNIGATTGVGTLTFGRSTQAQTINIGTGITSNATTKTINIGTTGATTSIQAITIGRFSATAATFTTINSNTITLNASSIIFSNAVSNLTLPSIFSQTPQNVANLIGFGVAGSRAFVVDAVSPVFGQIVVDGAGTGTNVPVYFDGTNWRVG